MSVATLLRGKSTLYGSFGLLTLGGFTCRTAELPWVNNEVGRSCIPLGTYLVVPHDSPQFGRSLHVTNVPGRTEILFHVGNWAAHRDMIEARSNSLGCILPGERFVQNLGGQPGVSNSRKTLDALLRAVSGEPFMLNIADASDLISMKITRS